MGVRPADPYRPDIDGLRAIAVLLVVGYHAFPGVVPGGFIGVDIFFVISGYLITGMLLDDLERGRFSLAGFYARRVRRILPALTLVLATCLLVGWFMLLRVEYSQLLQHVGWGAGFLSNVLLWRESGLYFNAAAETKPLLHLWSLGGEEQFYLVWPLVLWVAYGFRAIGLATGAIALLSFGLNVWGMADHPVGTFYLPHSRFWELMVGALLACLPHLLPSLPRQGPDEAYAPEVDALIADIKSWLGALCIVAAVILIDTQSPFPGWWALLPTVGAALLIAAGPGAVLNRIVLSHPVAVAMGLVSYPLYLWHWPLLAFLRIDYGETPPAAARLAAVALSFVLAFATYRWLEGPVRMIEQTQFTTDDIMRKELLNTVGALTARGKSVLLLDDVPAFSFDATACKYLRPLSRTNRCTEARRSIDTQRREGRHPGAPGGRLPLLLQRPGMPDGE